MLVHLTTSTITLKDEPEVIETIKNSVNKSGHKLLSDWIVAARKRIKHSIPHEPSAILKENMALISKADAIIAEITHDSIGVGYQIAIAVQLNKPLLLLTQTGKGNKMMQGLETNLVSYQQYNSKTLDKIISNFLASNSVSTKDLRFNFFIDREIYNYLRSVSYETGRSKSRILRDAIRKEIRNNH